MLPLSLENWVPRPPMTSVPMSGRYVQVDPFNLDTDVPLLWDALGGNDGTLNELVKWWGMKDFDTPDDLRDLLQKIEEPEGWCVNVFRLLGDSDKNDDAQVAGMASYIFTNAEHGTTEVGFVVHGPAMQKSKASTEAHYLLAKRALQDCGYRRLEWKCDSNNGPSNRAAERYGYSYEGCFRNHRVTAKKANRDTCWYSMLDSEWAQRKLAFEGWLDPSNFDESGSQIKKLEDF